MSLLQNRWVVGGMATVAVSVVGFNLYGQFRPKRVTAMRPAAAVAPAPVTAPVAATAAPAAELQLDRGHFVAKMADWLQASPHDPFSPPITPVAELPKGPAAADVLKLQGTWRQTGGGVAVINRQTVSENEVVDGFTILRIEADRVLVTSPRGQEEITFPGVAVAVALAPVPTSAQQARLTPKP